MGVTRMGIVSDESTGVRAGLHRRGEPPRPGGQGTGAEREEAAQVDDPGKSGKAEELRPGPAGGVPLEGGGRRPPPPAAPRPGLPGHGGPPAGEARAAPPAGAGAGAQEVHDPPRPRPPPGGVVTGAERRGHRAVPKRGRLPRPPARMPGIRPSRSRVRGRGGPSRSRSPRSASRRQGRRREEPGGRGSAGPPSLRLPRRTIAPARTPPRTRCRHPCRPAP